LTGKLKLLIPNYISPSFITLEKRSVLSQPADGVFDRLNKCRTIKYLYIAKHYKSNTERHWGVNCVHDACCKWQRNYLVADFLSYFWRMVELIFVTLALLSWKNLRSDWALSLA